MQLRLNANLSKIVGKKGEQYIHRHTYTAMCSFVWPINYKAIECRNVHAFYDTYGVFVCL